MNFSCSIIWVVWIWSHLLGGRGGIWNSLSEEDSCQKMLVCSVCFLGKRNSTIAKAKAQYSFSLRRQNIPKSQLREIFIVVPSWITFLRSRFYNTHQISATRGTTSTKIEVWDLGVRFRILSLHNCPRLYQCLIIFSNIVSRITELQKAWRMD